MTSWIDGNTNLCIYDNINCQLAGSYFKEMLKNFIHITHYCMHSALQHAFYYNPMTELNETLYRHLSELV